VTRAEQMRALIHRHFQACNDADVETMSACFVPEGTHYFQPTCMKARSGVRTRSRVAGLRLRSAQVVASETDRVAARGIRRLKLHETDLDCVRAARTEAGAKLDLMLDVNYAWTPSEARKVGSTAVRRADLDRGAGVAAAGCSGHRSRAREGDGADGGKVKMPLPSPRPMRSPRLARVTTSSRGSPRSASPDFGGWQTMPLPTVRR
jgi:hypothetical protein